MIDPNVIDAMLAAGCTAEQIAAVVKADARADAEKVAARREADRIRKRESRSREKQDKTTFASDLSRGQTVTARDAVDTVSPKEIPPTPPKEITPSRITPSTPTGSSPTPRAELEAVLDARHAAAVLDHRQRLRKPLTAHAAALLAKRLAEFPDPNAAADTMIERGWQSIRPGWGEDAPRNRAGPGGRQAPIDHFRNYADELRNGQDRDDAGATGDRHDAPGLPVRAIEHHS